MLFNSYIFIFLFLPLALLGYFLLNGWGRYEAAKYYLAVMSLWFYAYFNVSYLWIILASIGVNYLCHLRMTAPSRKGKAIAGLWFGTGILFNLGLLFYFKYYDFFVENINCLFRASFTLKNILLPMGISFFTFQQIAFLVDVRRGEVERQPVSDYLLFVTFFPQLIAGPIVSHREMLPQFRELQLKRPDAGNLYTGFCIFAAGLAKKILLADVFGQAVNWGYGYSHLLSGAGAALVIFFYALQIYFDFSGYCDMAVGIGYLFNLRIPVNFMSPYKAENIADFWGRWHITLTRFFTGYLYIPLGGNRRGRLRTYLNVLLVFFVSGIWHGAGYTFILWGLLHGVMNIVTRVFHEWKKRLAFLKKEPEILQKAQKALAVAVTFAAVSVAWVFFRADSISQALSILGSLSDRSKPNVYGELASFFTLPEAGYVFKLLHMEDMAFVPYFPMVCYCAAAVFLIWGCRSMTESKGRQGPAPTVLNCVLFSALFLWCLFSFSGVSIFLYFNF